MKRENYIDVLKGLAIIFVVTTHCTWTQQERLKYLFPYWIGMAVPMFMVVSGYVNAKSFAKKNICNLAGAYDVVSILEKIIRYTVPFFLAYTFEVIFLDYFGLLEWNGLKGYFNGFDVGGYGPGSYYYPILLQIVFLFPIIFLVVQNYHHYGLLVCFIANIIYELFATYLPIDPNTYRLELYRYTFLIAFGCYVGLNGVLNKFVSVALAVLGVFFTYLICYRGNNLFLQEGWAGTSLLPSLMIFPIFYWVRKLQLRCKPLELIGKASYHIFLVQMVYFQFSSIIYPMMKRRALQTPVSIVVCILVGIAFYCIEKPITKLVVRAYRKMISLIDADVQNS